MFEHKKFRAALLSSLVAGLGSYSTGLATTGDFVKSIGFIDWFLVISPWAVAIGAQGIADFGKEKAKVEGQIFKERVWEAEQ